MIVDLIMVLVMLVLVTIIITQVIKPAWRGTPLFPWFRQESVLNDRLVELEQVATEQKLAQAVERKAHDIINSMESTNKESHNGH